MLNPLDSPFYFYLVAGANILSQISLNTNSIAANNQYDYVIIGGGASGCVVASRLTEDPKITVLLLETGGEGNRYSDIPGLAGAFYQTDNLISKYLPSETQNNSCLDFGGNCPLLIGNVLGGGSAHNYMMYVRGNKLDYDNWAKLGAVDWNYEKVLPFFKKSENFYSIYGNNPENNYYHGFSGPIGTTNQNNFEKFSNVLANGSRDIGFEFRDYNGEKQIGFSGGQSTIKNGIRQSSEFGYIRKIRNSRKNLFVKTFSTATKINFDKNRRAISVDYVDGKTGKKITAKAKREVILSAGAINTPKILINSGIGPKEQLTKFKIPIVKVLEGVGNNLMDHPTVSIFVTTNLSIPNLNKELDEEYCDYLEHKKGYFAFTQLCGLAFLNSSNSQKSLDDSRTELTFYCNPRNYTLTVIPESFDSAKYLQFFIDAEVIHPKSRGTVKVKSSNYQDDPLVDVNYFHEKSDLVDMRDGLKTILRLLNSKSMKKINAKAVDPQSANCKQFKLWSDDYLDCLIRYTSKSDWHYSGTAAMGFANSSRTVVNARLKVIGVKGLRVIDGSVMPVITRGNTYAPSLMIGEKGAAMVKENFDKDKANYL